MVHDVPSDVFVDNTISDQNRMALHDDLINAPPAGLEPAIFGLEVRRLVH